MQRPSWKMWSYNDGVKDHVGGGVVLLPPAHGPTPPSTHTHTLVWYVLFVQDGDGHAGPLGRVCPDGWAHLMVCV